MKSGKIDTVSSSKYASYCSRWSQKLVGIPAIAVLFLAHNSFAAVPAVVIDAQQTIGTGLSNPSAVAVAPNGTVYVADTNNNRVAQFLPNLPGTVTATKVPTPNLTGPLAVAVDAAGDLYLSDTPNLGLTARIIEMVADSTGAITTSSTVKTIYQGSLLSSPISLAVTSSNTLIIGNQSIFGNGIYYIPSTGGSPVSLNVTGMGAYTPAGLAVSGSNLFISNSSATGNGIYVASTSGGAAKPVLMGSFTIQAPQAVALDSAGDLFVLAQVSGATSESVIEVPNASAVNQSTPYIIPATNLPNGGGLAVDPQGNVDIAGTQVATPRSNLLVQLNFAGPVYLGASNVAQSTAGIVFNFEFNAPANFTGLRAITTGDLGSNGNDVVQGTTGNCVNRNITTASATAPSSCYRQFQATPQYVGTRASAIQVLGSGSAVLKSTPVYELGQGGAQINYPLDTVATPLGLIQPQGVTISGFDQTVYIADFLGDKVYSVSGLNGSQAKVVSTGSFTLSAPSAVAMNAEGDLYIADFNLGKVYVVPTTTGVAAYELNTGGLLQHPISLAVDALNDLYIGDAGSYGDDASSANPGFVVEVPYTGSPFVLPTNGVSIVFPQALAFNNTNGVLAIGDGGDVSTGLGQVVEVNASGVANVVSITNPAPTYDPAGLSFDAAGTLYVLDGVANTITQVFTNGNTALLSFSAPADLSQPSALASSAGSQSLVVANIGSGAANSLVYLNGNSVTLAFGDQTVNTVSASQTVTVANIGNQNMTLGAPYYNAVNGFSLGTGSTCANNQNLTSLKTCALAFQFAPTRVAVYNKTSGVNSDAYNSGTPAITLTGNGVAKAQLSAAVRKAERRAARVGRKSFAQRGR